MINFDDKAKQIVLENEKKCTKKFEEIDSIELFNQLKVLNAFQENNVQSYQFIGSTGYGHNDIGKDTLCSVFASIFHTESAFVSPLISSGTEAISQSLFGLLRPNDNFLAISGIPYDTLERIIYGAEGENIGSLRDYDISFDKVDLVDNDFDMPTILTKIKQNNPKIIYIQRSRGYAIRNALSITQIGNAISKIKKITNAYIVVDNCYGEFTEELEPTDVGADLIIGSLLKNIGGGVAPTGGYIAGKAKLVELITYKMTSPALGRDIGSYSPGYKLFFQGVFVAPHIVAQSKKVLALTCACMSALGIKTYPSIDDTFSDIVCTILLKDKDKLLNFINAIQHSSAVDSNVDIVAGEMDGYADKIAMASGSFNQGSSIELSCDGPMREPYAAFMQGSLSYTHGKIALINAIKSIL